MVLINTETTGQTETNMVSHLALQRTAILTQFSFAHPIDPKNECILLFSMTNSHFQGQFYKIQGQFQDKWHYF